MEQIKTDVLVIGAGAVGLAVAERMSRTRPDLTVVERNESFGRETSSRNSEVIHAGIYYAEGSLKARLCVEGSGMLYDFCESEGIPIRRIGKIVVGNTEDEIAQIHALLARGTANGARDLRLLTKAEMAEIEPELRCGIGMLSPSTGIFDSHRYMARLEAMASSRGAVFAYGTEAMSAQRNGASWSVTVGDADGEEIEVVADTVINAAGLSADSFAENSGIALDDADYRQLPCKGEYFRVADGLRGRINMLIYPPDTKRLAGQPADNVHLVISLDGGMKVGPNRIWGVRDGYEVDSEHGPFFREEMSRFLPLLADAEFTPDMSGIRAMRNGEDREFRDFIIREESDRGMPGLVNLIGIQSPGLTSSLAIAKEVARLL